MNAADRSTTIDARDLTKRFGSFTAVDRITFSVAAGEIFGFLGANGAGKTTENVMRSTAVKEPKRFVRSRASMVVDRSAAYSSPVRTGPRWSAPARSTASAEGRRVLTYEPLSRLARPLPARRHAGRQASGWMSDMPHG